MTDEADDDTEAGSPPSEADVETGKRSPDMIVPSKSHPLGTISINPLSTAAGFSGIADRITPFPLAASNLFGAAPVLSGIGDRMGPLVAPFLSQSREHIARMMTGLAPLIDAQRMFEHQNFAGLLGIESAMRNWTASLANSLSGLRDLTRDIYPDNLLDVGGDLDLYTSWMMDEGLPIAWVPNSQTMALIVAAPTSGARRSVYGRRWRGVLNDCQTRLNATTSAEIQPYVGFAKKAVEAMRSGYPEAAQALAANTLDTVLSTYFDGQTRKEIAGKARIDPDEYGVRQYFIFAQIWGIHRSFWPDKGDPIPGTFNRHGTVHGVSRRQYSRINGVLGIAHLTGVLWFLNLFYIRRK